MQPPLRAGLRLTGLVHAIEHLVEVLASYLGKDLTGRPSKRGDRRSHCAVSLVGRDEAMVWPLQANQHRGDILEDAARVLGRTDGLVPVLFGHHLAVPPPDLPADRVANHVECADAFVTRLPVDYQRLPAARCNSLLTAGRQLRCR